MSTPSTATATLPLNSHYYSSHHQNYQTGNSSAYKSNNNLNLNGPSRSYAPIPPSHVSGSITPSLPPIRDPQRQLPPLPNTPFDNGRMSYAHSAASGPPSSSKKRQRSRAPDWQEFYRHGLPKEVIIIDDSPPPHPQPKSLQSNQQPIPRTTQKHAAKKQKREDVPLAPYDPVYHLQQTPSNGDLHNLSHASSTTSTDRTTSAAHTTAGTSLGSQYSHNGIVPHANEFVEQPGQKRKRVVARKDSGDDVKRREVEIPEDTIKKYRPPPRPPIKAPEINVKVVHDVCRHNL